MKKEKTIRKGYLLPESIVKMVEKIRKDRSMKTEVDAVVYCIYEINKTLYKDK